MKRLTQWIDDGERIYAVPCMELKNNGHQKCCDKLASYEDAEEQGLLIRLPCKVGDDVWTIMCGMTGKHPALFRQEFTLSMFSHFGTAVFLTKEEAEAALAEMEG